MHARGKTAGTSWVNTLNHDHRKYYVVGVAPRCSGLDAVAPSAATCGILEGQEANKGVQGRYVSAQKPSSSCSTLSILERDSYRSDLVKGRTGCSKLCFFL